MRFALLSLLVGFLATFAVAIAPLKPVIISFPNKTPQHIVDDAMSQIRTAGGKITHTYTLIKGFACEASTAAIERVQAFGAPYNALIEEDQVVHANGL